MKKKTNEGGVATARNSTKPSKKDLINQIMSHFCIMGLNLEMKIQQKGQKLLKID